MATPATACCAASTFLANAVKVTPGPKGRNVVLVIGWLVHGHIGGLSF
jgi:chromate transport protein ChrA